MKKHLLKLGAACLALAFSANVMAQGDFTLYQLEGDYPAIDGDKTEWANISLHPIVTEWSGQTVSYDADASFCAVWDDDNIYVLVEVPDDDFYPSEESGTASWLADKPELYFDVNATLVDLGGPSDDAGHYQFAYAFMEDAPTDHEAVYDATLVKGDDSKAYFVEYKIPLATLVDADDVACDGSRDIGFDITLIDLDEDGKGATTAESQRINYQNDASVDETWNTMDHSAVLTFSYDYDPGRGVNPSVGDKASNVRVLNATYVTNGTLEFNVEVSNVQVVNSVGQVVATSTDVSNLTSGVYIVSVQTENGLVANRFMKK